MKNKLPVTKGVYDQVIYDSGTERIYAQALELREDVRVFAKLPGWSKIPTPPSSYHPDWAVLVEKDRGLQPYFVVETKPSLFGEDLLGCEEGKIACGKRHFEGIGFEGFRRGVVLGDLE